MIQQKLLLQHPKPPQITNAQFVGSGDNVHVECEALPHYEVYVRWGNTTELKQYQLKNDFKGKIAGSVVENPHISKRINGTNLKAPNDISWAELDNTQGVNSYYGIMENDSLLTTQSVLGLNMAQHLFSFNVIEMIERTYNEKFWNKNDSLPNKLTIARNIIKNITCNWYGFGSSPLGNKAYLQRWGNNTWFGGTTNTSSTTSKIITSTTNMSEITPEGFMHFIAYADKSDNVKNSIINTNYVELLLDVEVEESIENPPLNNLETGKADSEGHFRTLNPLTTIKNKAIARVSQSENIGGEDEFESDYVEIEYRI